MRNPYLTILIETPEGTAERRIMPASVLPPDVRRGDAAEDATRNAAAYWGLPDFVFRPAIQASGSGSRELGDAIIVVGDRAASVQVKAREGRGTASDRERSWLDKKIAEGAKQARGTIRTLRYGGRVALINERGRRVTINTGSKEWVAVVVLDHPGLEGYVPAGDAVVLLRQDWEFLFEQLKSTFAVVEYLHRVSRGRDHVPLGEEAVRYYELAAADLATEPDPLDPRLQTTGAQPHSAPLLPQRPVEHGELVRGMLEDIATTRHPDDADPADVLDVLARIDAAPVSTRIALGEAIMEWLQEVAREPEGNMRWRFRRMIWHD